MLSTNEAKSQLLTDLPTSLLPQLTSPLPDFSVVKALQLLVWSAACGDFSLSQDPTNIHQMFVKV